MTLLMSNGVAKVYRGNPPTLIYGGASGVDCNVQPRRPSPGYIQAAQQNGEQLPTHRIFLDLPSADTVYTSLLNDEIYVSGTTGAHLDGYYSVVSYSQAHIQPLIGLDYIDIDARFLGAKKTGDTVGADDNSGVLRFG